jgi:hypothetical protein
LLSFQIVYIAGRLIIPETISSLLRAEIAKKPDMHIRFVLKYRENRER